MPAEGTREPVPRDEVRTRQRTAVKEVARRLAFQRRADSCEGRLVVGIKHILQLPTGRPFTVVHPLQHLDRCDQCGSSQRLGRFVIGNPSRPHVIPSGHFCEVEQSQVVMIVDAATTEISHL